MKKLLFYILNFIGSFIAVPFRIAGFFMAVWFVLMVISKDPNITTGMMLSVFLTSVVFFSFYYLFSGRSTSK